MIEKTNKPIQTTTSKQRVTNNSPAKPQPSYKKKEYVTKDGLTVLLTDKQKAYADLKNERPGESLRAIAREVYDTSNDNTLGQIVHQNERNTNIIAYNAQQVEVAKNTVFEIASNKESKDRDRLAASFDILDRNLGRAIQRTEQVNNGVQLVINLTGEVTD